MLIAWHPRTTAICMLVALLSAARIFMTEPPPLKLVYPDCSNQKCMARNADGWLAVYGGVIYQFDLDGKLIGPATAILAPRLAIQ